MSKVSKEKLRIVEELFEAIYDESQARGDVQKSVAFESMAEVLDEYIEQFLREKVT